MTASLRTSIPIPHQLWHVPLRPLRMRPVFRMRQRGPADQKLVERVRREFNDMRGLSPTWAQARRLFHLDEEECSGILAQLIHERFLELCADERYRRSAPQADFAK